MTFPEKLATAVSVAGLVAPDGGWFAIVDECEGARFHSPNPLVLRKVFLAPDGTGITANVCGTCADNLTVLQRLLVKCDGDVDWPVRREFGNLVRALAQKGWEDYQSRMGHG
jgi:hypothetical protein